MVKTIKQRQEETKLTFVWKHPKYYKPATNCRRDKTTQKGKENENEKAASTKQQASSDKQQAASETEQDSN